MNVCSICKHAQRPAIDAALVENGSLRAIAKTYGLTRSSVDRHKKHLPKALTVAKQAEEITQSTSLLSRVERLMSRMESICEKATEQKHWSGAVGASRELRCCLELLAKMSGELQPASINIGIQTCIQSTLTLMTDEQIEAELRQLLAPDRSLENAPPDVVELTEVERLVRCGFAADSVLVRDALREKERKITVYQSSLAVLPFTLMAVQ